MKKETNNDQAALAREEGLVIQELSDELLVYDLKRHKAHYLNKTAAFIWNQCDGQRTVADMAALLQQQTGVPVNEEVIWYGLDKLGQAHLLEKKLSSPANNGLTRRRLMRQLGQGALLAIPVIGSLIAPNAAYAASTVTTTNGGGNPGVCSGKAACAGACCNNASNNKICTGGTCSGAPCVSTGPNCQNL